MKQDRRRFTDVDQNKVCILVILAILAVAVAL